MEYLLCSLTFIWTPCTLTFTEEFCSLSSKSMRKVRILHFMGFRPNIKCCDTHDRHLRLYVWCQCFWSVCLYLHPPHFSQKNVMSHNCTCHYDSNHSSEWPHMVQKKIGCIQFEYWWRGVARSLMFYKVGLFISRTLPLVTLMFVLKADFLVLFSSVRHYCHTFYGSIWLHIWSYEVKSCAERKDSNQRYAKYGLTFR